MPDRGTRNAIFVLRRLVEIMIEKQKDVYVCFIDYSKAFDSMKHKSLIELLQSLDIDSQYVKLLANLYWNQKAAVREQVDRFIYLGNLFTSDGRCEQDVRQRIAIAKSAFISLEKVLKNRNINIQLRCRFLKCYVCSTLLYGFEAWTLSSKMLNKLEATEMWFLRSMQKIPYPEHVTHVEVLRRAHTKRKLLGEMVNRHVKFFGHVMRNEEIENLEGCSKNVHFCCPLPFYLYYFLCKHIVIATRHTARSSASPVII